MSGFRVEHDTALRSVPRACWLRKSPGGSVLPGRYARLRSMRVCCLRLSLQFITEFAGKEHCDLRHDLYLVISFTMYCDFLHNVYEWGSGRGFAPRMVWTYRVRPDLH